MESGFIRLDVWFGSVTHLQGIAICEIRRDVARVVTGIYGLLFRDGRDSGCR